MSTVSNKQMSLTLPNGNGVTINYEEFPVPNTSYSKIILEDGRVAVIVHSNHGNGWSTCFSNKYVKNKLIFDSRLVLYILSAEFQRLFNQRQYRDLPEKEPDSWEETPYEDFIRSITPISIITKEAIDAFKALMDSIFSETEIDKLNETEMFDLDMETSRLDAWTFSKLSIRFVPENSLFRITEDDGAESIDILDIDSYINA